MPGFTKRAIRNSFIRLLNERPVSQITVKDIVEDCGINRNSFYYHYKDLPSMLEEIILEEAEAMVRQHPSVDSIEECLDLAVSFALENRRAAMHLYSANRDLFERYLWRVCEHVVDTYISTAFAEYQLKEADRRVLVRNYKWECFGAVLDWLNGGMKEDIQADFYRLCELKKGMLEEVIRRSAGEQDPAFSGIPHASVEGRAGVTGRPVYGLRRALLPVRPDAKRHGKRVSIAQPGARME